MPAPRSNAVDIGGSMMNRLKAQPASTSPQKDEFGRIIEFSGTGFKTAGDIITYAKKTGAFDQAGSIISYGKTSVPPRQPLPENSAKKIVFGMDETTLPGDLLVRKSGLPIKSRMAALIRQRSLDMAGLMLDFLKRPGFSRLPQRGHAFVDIPTFRRCLCYAFGEQWSSLGMTTPEFLETYSPYIVREQTESGDALVSWKAFCKDILQTAGVDKGDLGYLKEEADLEMRMSVANDRSLDRSELDAVIDAEFSHDIETEEEAQQAVLKDVERVTGARSVAVTRYGSYESKLHGRNAMGVIKQGEFDKIGQTDEEAAEIRKAQGINADGSRVKLVNTQISGQTHEFAADGSIEVSGVDAVYDAKKAANATSYSADAQASLGGKSMSQTGALSNADAVAKARREAADAEARKQAKALKFQQMMQAKFGQEVENQIDADDDQDAEAVNTSTYFQESQKEGHFASKKAPPPSGGYAAITKTNFAYGFHGNSHAVDLEGRYTEATLSHDQLARAGTAADRKKK